MKAHHLSLFLIPSLFFICSITKTTATTKILSSSCSISRRILHQPLFPESSAPPPGTESPPPPDSPTFPNQGQPFFPEVPNGPSQDQKQTPPATATATTNGGGIPIPTATQPAKPAKRVAIAISVGIVTLGMLSALAFFLYRHRAKHPGGGAGESRKIVGRNSQRFQDEPGGPPSSFLYIGTVEPSRRSDRYRRSPELQPLPQLTKPPSSHDGSSSPVSMASSDEESHDTAFYTPRRSSIDNDDYCSNGMLNPARSDNPVHDSVPHSKRTSPRSRLLVSSPPPPVVVERLSQQSRHQDSPQAIPCSAKRLKISSPPPPPNMELLRSLNSNPSSQAANILPVPPPPPPPPPLTTPRKVGSSERSVSSTRQPHSWTSTPMEEANRTASASEKTEGGSMDGAKPKLKALHWDKVRATSDRATVWDQLKSSSFQLNEDMMESLFGCNSASSAPKEPIRKSVLPHFEHENRVLDPKKSQNIAILLRALNVTRDEVSEALLDGNPESLGPELLETLVKMAPTKEEEIKLREYNGDPSKLGSAERFLKAVLDIPYSFKRVEAMLYRANFHTEVKYLRKSYQTLEAASEELKNSRLFLKLLEAVLKTGNRMNVGTNRGDAKAFKLDTLLKLVDIKGTDGKTTLLHFVVQEIISNENLENKTQYSTKEDDFKKKGLQVVAGLGRDLNNVKKAAGMDSDVLSSYVSKLEMGLEKVRFIMQYEKSGMPGKFFNSTKMFLIEAEEGIALIKADERTALSLVKEVTAYFHGDTAKEEAHPLRIFMIVRDFLSTLDHVCKEVGNMQQQDRTTTMVGPARSFRISATASLPVLSRYNVRHDTSSDKESSSP